VLANGNTRTPVFYTKNHALFTYMPGGNKLLARDNKNNNNKWKEIPQKNKNTNTQYAHKSTQKKEKTV